jgi:tRNA threonylcarbamoyl adenosine modification protein (Sua5/YciO/YrdC/YwlC family)
MGDKKAMARIRRIRRLDDSHNFTLVCRDLSEISTYAKFGNVVYRLLKAHTPGAYTFILPATSEVPKRLMQAKRKTIGIRVPDNAVTQCLLDELGEPLMSTTLIMPGEELPLADPWEMRQTLEHEVDLVIDGGFCGFEATSVIAFEDDVPVLVRQGKGSVEDFV